MISPMVFLTIFGYLLMTLPYLLSSIMPLKAKLFQLLKTLVQKKNWSNTWAVDFNANKTVNVDFTRKKINIPKIQFGYSGEVINQQNSYIHLSLHFQSGGSWSKHISIVSMKKHAKG